MVHRRLAGVCVLAVVVGTAAASHGQEAGGVWQRFQRDEVQLPAEQAAPPSSDRRIVTGTPRPTRPHELVAAGLLTAPGTSDALARAAADIEVFAGGRWVAQIGRFSDPPVLADLAALSLDDGDLEALRRCRVGACGVKLTPAMLGRLSRDVPWTSSELGARATAVFRSLLLERVLACATGGPGALDTYVDRPAPVDAAAEMSDLLATSAFLSGAPAALRPCRGRQSTTDGDVRHILYWTRESYGFKPTVTMVDLAIWRPETRRDVVVLVATQIYASHYVEASVAITVGVPEDRVAPPSLRLLFLHKARIDALRGGAPWLTRWGVGRRLRQRATDTLEHQRMRLEASAVPPADAAARQGGLP